MLELGSDEVVTYTAEDAIEQLGFGCFQWKIILLASMFAVWSLDCYSFVTYIDISLFVVALCIL